MKRFFPLLAAFWLVLASGAPGQYEKGVVVSEPSPGPGVPLVAPGNPAEAKAAAAQPGKETPRLQKLRQLTFDRRPSAILSAWSNPPKVVGPKAEKDKGTTKPPTVDPIDLELQALQRHVTLGNWADVKKYLAGLPEEEGKAGYKQMLQSLGSGPMAGGMPMQMRQMQMMGMMPQMMQYMERNTFSTDDVLGLAAAAPRGLDKDMAAGLGGILRQALGAGTVVETFVARLRVETLKPAGQGALARRQAAQVLMAADQAAEAGEFLPSVEQARTEKDHEALNLLARHYLALHAKERKPVHLEKAWTVTQAILATPEGPRPEKEEALKRAVELAPRVREELGQAWLEESFTKQPQRGREILATLGTLVSQGLQMNAMNPDVRHKQLQLQKAAVEALVKAAPKLAAEWRSGLTLLAGNWLKEAEFSHQFARTTSLGPHMHRDRWGNLYYMNDEPYPYMMAQQQNMPRPVGSGEVLESRPGEAWLALVDDGMKPKLAMVFANLYLKVNEEAKAFPYIEQMAVTHRAKARELVSEFLRVWTKNHDPNAARSYTNPYMWMYGFERRAESVPLTRSKQERNLVELADWVRRLRKLPVGELDEELLAKAFTTCHSSAEVYRLEAIETVFGPMGSLKPRTLSEMTQQMRENLAGLWRQPAVQKDKQTNRKQKDIEFEVLRGYDLARTTIDNAMKKFPEDWSLCLARAALLHDENGYRQELTKSTEYAPRRNEAMAEFARAAKLYAAAVPKLAEDEETTKVYEQWFYASLGATDLQHIDEEKLPDLRQAAHIKKAIQALPGEAAARHLGKFANTLFTRMSALKPAVKFRYLKCGFEIVGDHKQAFEARKVYDYYKDLVTELKLEAVIDGSDVVAPNQPFGVFVNLQHTREIERESGGFGRYLQNQNSSLYWAYNYGRPTADYRDKFQAAATEALKEHFEVLSVTFQSDKVNSKATREYGWRVTPYAYLLLKPRGPEVDKIPPLRIDLDFLDTSGYVILPIESPAVPLEAKTARLEPRPFRKLQVTQTLDERQADQGKLVLEVKATALGLVPDLDQIVDLGPEGFTIAKTDDQGISVARFDPDGEETAVASERTWMVTLQAKPDLPQPPKVFQFGTTKVDGATTTYQRYKDADLVAVPQEVSLEEKYGKRSFRWLWALGIAGFVFVGALVAAILLLRKPRAVQASKWKLPEPLTPFTVLGLLQRIEENNGFDDTQKGELRQSIQLLERHYFADEPNGDLDLRQLAESWVGKAR